MYSLMSFFLVGLFGLGGLFLFVFLFGFCLCIGLEGRNKCRSRILNMILVVGSCKHCIGGLVKDGGCIYSFLHVNLCHSIIVLHDLGRIWLLSLFPPIRHLAYGFYRKIRIDCLLLAFIWKYSCLELLCLLLGRKWCLVLSFIVWRLILKLFRLIGRLSLGNLLVWRLV